MENTFEDKLTYAAFMQALEFQATIGQLFLEYNNVSIEGKPSVAKYVHSKKYYFAYGENCLWEEIPSQNMVSTIDNWIRCQARIIIQDLGSSKTEQDQALELFKTIKSVCRRAYLKDVVELITPMMTDDKIFDKLDKSQPLLLPIKDCQVIDLTTGKTRPRSITDYFTWECEVKPVKKYSEFFLNTISSIMCNDTARIDYLKKVLGYCLTGSIEAQSYFIWYGRGSNGKSLILNLLSAVLGKACKPISKGVVVNCGRKGEAGTEILALKDLRVGTFSETCKMEALNEGTLKTLSGGDKLTARGLYRDPVEFKVFLKLIICTNHKPEFDGSDQGTVRRIKLLPFQAKFTRDTPNPAKNEYPIIENLENILIEKHLDEFFSWCLEGCALWYQDKGFKVIPDEIQLHQTNYIREQNSFVTWFNENVIKDDTMNLERSFACKHYDAYCTDQGVKPQTKKDFIEKLNEELGTAKKSHGCFVYKGYKIKIEAESESDDDKPRSNLDD
jgi:P4 family phage/plasmid primase-like protien